MEQVDFDITFWGVRGSRPAPGKDTLKFGGNTPSIQIEINDQLLIFDAGTGICDLGRKLNKENDLIQGQIFITHTHWDHIQGFPFFDPFFEKNNSFNIYGKEGIKDLLYEQMAKPYFPIQLDDLAAGLKFYEVGQEGELFLENNIKIEMFETNHPNGCISFRINHDGRSCCYMTDIEHNQNLNNQLINFVYEADVVIYDAAYTNSEYLGQDNSLGKKGWGHSTWQEGIKVAKVAQVDKLVLFHHHPYRSDDQLEEIEEQAQLVYSNCVAAREGMVISL